MADLFRRLRRSAMGPMWLALILLLVSTVAVSGAGPVNPVDFWVGTTHLNPPRHSLGAITVGDTVFVIGGYNGSAPMKTVQGAAIQPGTDEGGLANTWTDMELLPEPLYLHAVAAIDSDVYVIGGYDGSNYRSEVWHATVSPGGTLSGWAPIGNYRFPVVQHRAVAVKDAGGKKWLYVAGGASQSGVTNQVYYASISGATPIPASSWKQAPSISTVSALYRHALASNGTTLYVIGGFNGSAVQGTVWRASITAGTGALSPWATQSLPAPREYHQAVIYPDRLEVLGGRDRNNNLLQSVISAPIGQGGSLGSWSKHADLPAGIYRFAATVGYVNGGTLPYIYALGGAANSTSNVPPSPTTQAYRSDYQPWVSASIAQAEVTTPTPPGDPGTDYTYTVNYTLTLSNDSPRPALSVVVTDTAPFAVMPDGKKLMVIGPILDNGELKGDAVVWSGISLDPGGTKSLRFKAVFVETAAGADPITPTITNPGATLTWSGTCPSQAACQNSTGPLFWSPKQEWLPIVLR